MNTLMSRLARAAMIAGAALAAMGFGCKNCPSRDTAVATAQVEEDVRALLDQWVQSFESRDVVAVRSILANDDRFVWLEDGEVRYQSVDAVIAALASFPTEMQFSHELASIRIVPISACAAWAQLTTTTEIRQGGRVVSEFAGVVLLLAQRDHGAWRIVAAHTSTTRPRAQQSREQIDDVFDSNGVKIRYVMAGAGEAVVLIHGWMGDSSMWGSDPSGSTKLKGTDGLRAIALDCRGHGKSDKPHEPEKYGPEMAADVVRLLDHLQIEKAHLVGYSSGAFIAGKVAATHPERVLSVIYAGQAPVIAGKVMATDFSECDTFAQAVEEGHDLGSYIIAVTPESRPRPTEEQAKLIAQWMFAGKDVKALAAAGRSFKDLAVSEDDLKKCLAPILFIHGGNESAHVKGRVAMVHKLLGRGEVRIIEGGDHMTTLAKPEFASAVIEFLRSSAGKNKPTDEAGEPVR